MICAPATYMRCFHLCPHCHISLHLNPKMNPHRKNVVNFSGFVRMVALTFQETIECLSRTLLHGRLDVAVHIQGNRDGAMTQHGRHDGGMDSLAQQQGRAGVPQIMESD
jgi:hypothetical protein